MKGRNFVSPGGMKIFYARSSDLSHPFAGMFTQCAWSEDFEQSTPFVAAKALFTLCDRREVTSATGASEWKYHGKCQDAKEFECLPETEILNSFIIYRLTYDFCTSGYARLPIRPFERR